MQDLLGESISPGILTVGVLAGFVLTVLPIVGTVYGVIILMRIRRSVETVLTRLDAISAQIDAKR